MFSDQTEQYNEVMKGSSTGKSLDHFKMDVGTDQEGGGGGGTQSG